MRVTFHFLRPWLTMWRSDLATWLLRFDNARREPRWQHYCYPPLLPVVISDVMRNFYKTIHTSDLCGKIELELENEKVRRDVWWTLDKWLWSQVRWSCLVTPEICGQDEIPGVRGDRGLSRSWSAPAAQGGGCVNCWHAQANYNHHTPCYRSRPPPSLSLSLFDPKPISPLALSTLTMPHDLLRASQWRQVKYYCVVRFYYIALINVVIQIFAHYSNFTQ